MLHRLIHKVIYIGIVFLITFSQVSSFSGEINSKNSYLENNKIETIEKIDLVITAFYSPLPNQKKYITGTYEKEIALNGDGVGMASGKKVFTGALAAPKKYDFGTKIYIEGYGVGVVEDRGGSIIDAEHTKIDIWMGYGDEGLQRAINWGSRKMTGYIVGNETKISLELKSTLEDSYKNLNLSPESNYDEIIKVQEFFKEIGFYYGEINGKYENIKPVIIKYQIQRGIIQSETDESAGYLGPKTISSLASDLGLVLKNENSLSKNEKDKILKKIINIQNKLGDKYHINAEKILKKIKILKCNEKLSEKTKKQLEYLEIIL